MADPTWPEDFWTRPDEPWGVLDEGVEQNPFGEGAISAETQEPSEIDALDLHLDRAGIFTFLGFEVSKEALERKGSPYKRVIDSNGSDYEHRVAYREIHGEIPIGHDVHHKDGDKTNNDPENLQALSRSDHQRTASENYRMTEEEIWERRCSKCGDWKPTTKEHYWLYPKKDRRAGQLRDNRCKKCAPKIKAYEPEKRRSLGG